MASYKSGFDPPSRLGDRPEETTRAKRLGTYMPQGPPKQPQREKDVTKRLGGQAADFRRAQTSFPFTSHSTAVPRPSLRAPSPNPSGNPDARHQGTTSSSFGFRKPAPRPAPRPAAGEAPVPQLRGKSSRNVLRRKQSSIAQTTTTSRPLVERTESSSSKKPSRPSGERRPSFETQRSAEAYNDIFTRTRPRVPAPLTTKDTPGIIPELDRYRTRAEHSTKRSGLPHKLATHDLPPPTPLLSGTPGNSAPNSHHRYSGYSGSGYSASPSTRFSESPVPGAYSRDTTPTSMSSQSPGVMAPSKGPSTPRLRQASPAQSRPPVTRRRAGSAPQEPAEGVVPDRLPVLRESGLSSSSNSTVKAGDEGKAREGKRKKRLSPLPPSPPPRKSSQKLKPSPRKEPEPWKEEESPSRPSQAPAKPVMTSPLMSSPPRLRPAASLSSGKPKVPVRPSRDGAPDLQAQLAEIMNPAASPTSIKPKVPVRPSREGAPDLQTQLGDSLKIIQSNLSGINHTQEKRRSTLPRGVQPSPLQTSQPKFSRGVPASPLQTIQTSFPSRTVQGSRLPARNPSPSPISPLTREATPTPAGLGIIPDLRPQQIPPSSGGTVSRSPSPSVANSRPRFGLFGRRTKTAPEVPTLDTEKKIRRGPAAGTGHEGYGRYGLRGRSGSATSVGHAQDQSLSRPRQDKNGAPLSRDPFFLERMSPVIIAGGGEIKENRNSLTRTESNTSILLGRAAGVESRESNRSKVSSEEPRTTLWPSALPKEPIKRASAIAVPKGRRPSDSSDDGIGMGRSALPFRRSIQRLNSSAPALDLPKPLKMSNPGAATSMASLAASVLSTESRVGAKPEAERGRKGQLTKPRKLEKRPTSPRKWNFFHRSKPAKQETQPALQVTVGKSRPKAVPHYAMLDSSDEQLEVDTLELEDILRQADAAVVDLTNEELDILQFGNHRENVRRIEDFEMAITTPVTEKPAASVLSASPHSPQRIEVVPTPEVFKDNLNLGKEAAPVRPSRLPQVGRIPKVISARPEATSPKSFSRPFARLSISQPAQIPLVIDRESVGLGPSPPKPSTPEPAHAAHLSADEPKAEQPRQDSGDAKTDSTAASHHDFLAFSPRKNSQNTTNTSSSGGNMSFAGITAVIPEPDAALEEDEVWDEYDDLIENEGAGVSRVPSSAASSMGRPFQYENYESRRVRKSKLPAKESPTLKATHQIKDTPTTLRQSFQTTSSVYSTDLNPKQKDALASIKTPTTPMSFADFISGYGDRNNGNSTTKSKRASQGSSNSSSDSRTSSLLAKIAEQENAAPVSQVNLRVGSMTVSKWLTFGHVLFSPGREEIEATGSTKSHSILVIDGLGNDDWSFYAAETYPHCQFYNLSPTPAPPPPSATTPNTPPLPKNHTQIPFPSLSTSTPFPFPPSTFHLIVFRFPPSLPLPCYSHIISESHRCLQQGGWLELAVMDIDMMGMGNRTRRSVRRLKEKIKEGDEGVFLGSVGDVVVCELGTGDKWESVKSCGVGIPVTSLKPTISHSRSGSSTSTTSTRKDQSTSKNSKPIEGQREKDAQLSLASLVSSPNTQKNDQNITKMVAKVGRWWYSRCYEVGNGVDPQEGVFSDSKVLAECEVWGASFKLVVGFARKGRGVVVRGRRGMSV